MLLKFRQEDVWRWAVETGSYTNSSTGSIPERCSINNENREEALQEYLDFKFQDKWKLVGKVDIENGDYVMIVQLKDVFPRFLEEYQKCF